MPLGDGRKVRDAMWTREKHAKARGLVREGMSSEVISALVGADTSAETRHASALVLKACDERDTMLSRSLDEIERLSKEIAYLWTAGGITPNPVNELAYAVWEAKEEVGV